VPATISSDKTPLRMRAIINNPFGLRDDLTPSPDDGDRRKGSGGAGIGAVPPSCKVTLDAGALEHIGDW